MKLTGERPMQGATPDSLLAFHDAGYREVLARLGSGITIDVGCGLGDETRRLVGSDRLVIGADYSTETVRAAASEHERTDGLRFSAFDDLAVSVDVSGTVQQPTEHFITRQTSYRSLPGSGDQTADDEGSLLRTSTQTAMR